MTAICPGWVATEMSRHSQITSEEMTQPIDVAHAVTFILQLPNNASLPVLTLNCEIEPKV
jgi:NADP-dependent 3-hydroxy acid dehydrogenase YdfG